MENRISITVDRDQVANWRVVKAQVSRDSSQSLTWGEFFDIVVGSYERPSESRFVQMAQELPEGEEVPGVTAVPDDAMTLEVAAMTGSAARLTEETCELIAEKVAEKIVERLKALYGKG